MPEISTFHGLLIEELHHRVANTYQALGATVVTNLRRATHPEAKAALARFAGQVQAFQAVHHLLRGAGANGHVDAAAFLGLLCEHVQTALFADGAVQVVLGAEPVALPPASCRHLGLAVNELVLNAAKHAFPNDRHGTITVLLAPGGSGWRCAVRDDGVGWASAGPEGFVQPAARPGVRKGSGLHLVAQLAAALDGRCTREAVIGGTSFVIEAPFDCRIGG